MNGLLSWFMKDKTTCNIPNVLKIYIVNEIEID